MLKFIASVLLALLATMTLLFGANGPGLSVAAIVVLVSTFSALICVAGETKHLSRR